MKFVCDSCGAQYMIADEKVGKSGVKVRCKKCSHVIIVRPAAPEAAADATVVMDNPLAGLDDTQEAPAFEDAGADAEIGAAFDSIFGGEDGGGLGGGFESEGAGESEGEGLVTDPAQPAPDARGPTDPFSAAVDSAFDAALGEVPPPPEDSENEGEFQTTRIFSTEDMQRVAEEREYAAGADAADSVDVDMEEGEPPVADDEDAEWYVAIDDEQIGPLTVADVQRHWEAGDLSPDSLVWKSGMADWDPLSSVDELKHLIAPTPASPGWQATAEPADEAPDEEMAAVGAAGAVNGAAHSPTADDDAPTWKPAAASLLASLAAEELSALDQEAEESSALAGPSVDPVAELEATAPAPSPDEPSGLGLDLPPPPPPSDDEAIPPPPEPSGGQPGLGAAAGAAGPSPTPAPFVPPPAANPAQPAAMAGGAVPATYPTPAPGYGGGAATAAPPPPAGLSTGKLIAIVGGIGGPVLLLVLVLVFRGLSSGPANADPIPEPAPDSPPVAQKTEPPVPETPPPSEAKAPEPEAEAVAEADAEADAGESADAATEAPEEPAAAKAPAPRQVAQAQPRRQRPPQQRTAPRSSPPQRQREPAPPPPQPTKQAEEEDLEAALFGTPSGRQRQAAGSTRGRDQPAGKGPYIPPAPGGGRQQDLPRSLSRGDIMAVVAGKRGDLRGCVDRQRAADPGTSGTLVMGWRIQPDGTPRNINVKSAEHRGTVMAGCVTQVIGTMRFPRYGGPQMPEVEFPFTF